MLDHPVKGLAESSNRNKQRENILALFIDEVQHSRTIEYYKKIVYGNERGYILDTGMAQAVYCVSGKTTLCNTTMKGLEMLGFSFKEVLPPKE
jgi:hypothetical protein